MRERDALRVEMAEARKQIAVCEEELGRALGLASEFRRKVGTFPRNPFTKLYLHLQGDHSEWRKPPVDLVLTVPAACVPLLWPPTAQAG